MLAFKSGRRKLNKLNFRSKGHGESHAHHKQGTMWRAKKVANIRTLKQNDAHTCQAPGRLHQHGGPRPHTAAQSSSSPQECFASRGPDHSPLFVLRTYMSAGGEGKKRRCCISMGISFEG